jgi:hypothetical protein
LKGNNKFKYESDDEIGMKQTKEMFERLNLEKK